MYLFRVRSFLSYWLNAVDEHSLHSPFLFDFYTSVIKARSLPSQYSNIERLRQELLRDHRSIQIVDFGSGSGRKPTRTIAEIARVSLSTPKFSAIYDRLARYIQAKNIVELGTSLGINTLYLANSRDAKVTTFEGSPAVADLASLTFEFVNAPVELIVGNIDHTLPQFLQRKEKIDLAFIDANHRFDPTIRYFEWLLEKTGEQSVIVLDDIHHSPEMVRAWQTVRSHRLVHASVDLYRCGIVFFDPSLNKQHVILQV